MMLAISLDSPLSQTYMAHAALLVVILLLLSPMSAMTWVNKGMFANPDVVRRAYLTELKSLAPFWVVGALYVTTNPPVKIGIYLFRIYTASRLLVAAEYTVASMHPILSDTAIITSHLITCYMAATAVLSYWRNV